MRDLVLMLVLLLAACESPSLVAVPAERWQPTSSDQQVTARSFAQVSDAVADAAGRECRRRSRSANCEFAILVVLNRRAPENAFQILDEVSRPQIIFTQPMIRLAQNDDEIAFVMGHEAAHHILGHIERRAEYVNESTRIFGDLARERGEDAAGIERARKLGAKVGAQNYSQEFELEADRLGGSVTSCLEICPRNAFLAPPGPHRSEGVAGTEMRAGRRKKHWRRNRDITEKAYPFCSDSISILWSWLALSPLFV